MYLDRETALSREHRATEGSAAAQREKLRKIIGVVDPRVPVHALEFDTVSAASPEIGRGGGYRVYAVRWGVFEDVEAEGLLLEPNGAAKARVVAIPDADWSPEMLAGLAPGVPCPPSSPGVSPRTAAGARPRTHRPSDTWSGIPGIRMTNQPHREWIYRMAFEAGRHIIGYEVQKILAAVDWFATRTRPAGADRRGGLWRRRAAGAVLREPRSADPGDAGQRIFPTARELGRSRSTAMSGACCASSATRKWRA